MKTGRKLHRSCIICVDGESKKIAAEFLLPRRCALFHMSGALTIVNVHHLHTRGEGKCIDVEPTNVSRFQIDVDRNLNFCSKSVIHGVDPMQNMKDNKQRITEVIVVIKQDIRSKTAVIVSLFLSSGLPTLCSLSRPSSFNTELSFYPIRGKVYIECICPFTSLPAVTICWAMCSIKSSKVSLQFRGFKRQQTDKILLFLSTWTRFLKLNLKFHPSREDHRKQLRRQIMKLSCYESMVINCCRLQVLKSVPKSDRKTIEDNDRKHYLPIDARWKELIATKTTEFFHDEFRSVNEMETARNGKHKEWIFAYNVYKFTEMHVFPVFRRNDLEYSFLQMLDGVPQLSSDIMRFEHHRLSSFANYSNDNAPSSLLLAKSGWYATGNGSETRTFCCLIVYSRWNGLDNPDSVHRDLNPDCAFLVGRDLGQVSIQDNVESRSHFADCTDSFHLSGIQTDFQNTHAAVSDLENTFSRSRTNELDTILIQSEDDGITESSSKVDGNANSSCSIDCPSRSLERRRPQTVSTHTHTSKINGISPLTNTCTHEIKPNLKNESSTEEERDTGKQTLKQKFQEPYLPPLMSEKPKHSEYSTVGVRASSFSGFPTVSRKTPKEFAIGGFYYRGFGDRTTCFHCGISLQGWGIEDDVYVEHVRNNPLCQYMRRLKGDDFVKLVMSVTQSQQIIPFHSEDHTGVNLGNCVSEKSSKDVASKLKEMGFGENSISAALGSVTTNNSQLTVQNVLDEILKDLSNEPINPGAMNAASNGTSRDYVENLEPVTCRENRNQSGSVASGIDHGLSNKPSNNTSELKDQFVCKICMEERVGVVFTPCGHIVTCSECSRSLRKCPICREVIRDKIHTVITD